MFDTFSGTSAGVIEAIFVLPLPLNEIALALWLILKGFNDVPHITVAGRTDGSIDAVPVGS